jgi:histidinol-phosphate phosphatase family protein
VRAPAGRGAVFLDRDGTVAVDVNYCRRPEDFHLLPRAAAAIALLNRAALPVVIVTNQSAIARGFVDWPTLDAINDRMRAELVQSGAAVDAVYVCPHLPDDGCDCRKPQPGLLRRAAADLGITLSRAYMVGDREMDVRAGQACGCTTVIVDTGPAPPSDEALREMGPDHHAHDLYDAARWIIAHAASGAAVP